MKYAFMLLVWVVGISLFVSVIIGIVLFTVDVIRFRSEHDFAEKRRIMIDEILSYMDDERSDEEADEEEGGDKHE